MNSPAKTSLPVWMWLAAGLLMLAEFLVFDRMTARYHASIYPRWSDQIQYLTEAYTAYDRMQADGLVAGLKTALGKAAVQGTLHDTCAVVVFWAVGSASRSAALSLNLFVFLAWQAALLFAIPRVGGSRVLAWMGFGLVLCLAHPWSGEAGSAVDFRLDHAAMCLFGVTSCALLLTDGFRSTGWSLAFGVAAGVTVLERFLTAVYFVPIFAAAGLWLLFQPERWPRLRHLLLAGSVLAAMVLPVFWFNRQGIHDYYWVGHITGAESTARLRGFDLMQSVQFVFGYLGGTHLGPMFGWTALTVTDLLLLQYFCVGRKPASGLAPDWLFAGLAFLLLPATILTLHRQKSEIAVGILAPGAVLLVLWLWHFLVRRLEFPAGGRWARLLPAWPALAVVAAGGGYFAACELPPPHSPAFIQGVNNINQVSDYIFTASRAAKLPCPSVGIDRIVDFMDGRVLRLVCYERHKTWVTFGVHLPDSILEGPDDAVLFKMKLCDFMILTDRMPEYGYWPYDRQMRRLYPELKAWCDANLTLVGNFTAFERDMSFYRRRELH